MQSTTGGTAPAREGISTRTLFVENSEIQLETWQRRLNRITDDAKGMDPESQEILEERVELLASKLEDAREQLDAMKGATTEYWEEAKTQFEATWDEITELFNRTDPPRSSPH